MTDLKAKFLAPKARAESWLCYRERILQAFYEAGNGARHVDEGKVAFNRRVKSWAAAAELPPERLPENASRRRNANESLRSYRQRIQAAFYDAETSSCYRERMRKGEGRVEFNRRVKAWAEGKPYVCVAKGFHSDTATQEAGIRITGYVVPETQDGTKHVAVLEHPLFHTTKVIMHMRHVPTNEYKGLFVSSLFNSNGTEHVYIRHNKYWGSKVVLRRLDFVDNPDSPVLNTYLSYDEPGGLAQPVGNVVWNTKYNRLAS